MRRLAREGVAVAVGQALVIGGRFGTLWWLTRVLDPAGFGQVALIQGVATLAFSVLCGSLLQAGLRFNAEAAIEGYAHGLRDLLRPLVMRMAWLTTASLGLGALVWRVASGSNVSPWALVAGLLVMVPDAVRWYELNVLNATRRQTAFAVWTGADAVARPLGAAIAISVAGPTPAAALAGISMAAVAVNVVCGWGYGRVEGDGPRAAPPADTKSRILRYAVPLMPLALMLWVVGLLDRYVLALTAGAGAAGLYAAVYGVGSQGFLALGTVGLAVFRPLYFTAIDGHDAGRGRRVLWVWLAAMAAGSLAGIAGLVLLGRPLARVCLGPQFQGGAYLLPWIGVAYTIQTLQTVFEVPLYAQHKTAPLLWVQIGGAATALVLYAILIPRYGAFGAVVATIGAFSVSSVLAATLGKFARAVRGEPA